MINLIDILKELGLEKGHARGESSYDMTLDALPFLLSPKSQVVYSKFKRSKKLDTEAVKPFIQTLLKRTPVAEEGRYKLLYKKGMVGLHAFYLIDAEATTIGSTFVGEMKLRKFDSWYLNTEKTFNLKTFQVNWSNIANEYRGKGLGKILYTLVYQYITSIGAALASDSTLYEGSSGMWRTYMPNIASYFGVIMSDVMLPVTKEDVTKASKVNKANISAFVAMENPPKLIRKIAHNVTGLSFINGEYGVLDTMGKNIKGNVGKYFLEIVKNTTSLSQLIKQLDKETTVFLKKAGTISQLKCLIVVFKDTVVAVKQMNNKLVMVSI